MKLKKSILVAAGFFFMIMETDAQIFDIGLGAIYGDDIGELGAHTRFYVNTPDHRFCLGPEFSWFPEHTVSKDDEEIRKNLTEFNFNAHINFDLTHQLGFYPLIGLNYSREKEEIFVSGVFEEEETFKEFGFNLGIGLHYKLKGHWILFAEYDHLFSDLSQNTFTLGFLVGFGKFKNSHHEETSEH